jgi:hypothetical protein
MTGETDLKKLLSTLSPQLLDDEYIFCTFPGAGYGEYANLAPFAAVQEPVGLTLVVPRSKADAAGIGYAAVFRAITLQVHSSLEAVGLTAAVSGKLAEVGISANLIAGYYHDHIFVPIVQAQDALQALADLG